MWSGAKGRVLKEKRLCEKATEIIFLQYLKAHVLQRRLREAMMQRDRTVWHIGLWKGGGAWRVGARR